jgi:hypothetical protein
VAQASQSFRHTHSAPATGMATWPNPGSTTNGPRLDPNLPVQLLRVYGEWAEVACSNGWTTWVDGHALVPVGMTASPAGEPPSAPASAPAAVPTRPSTTTFGRYTFVTPTKATWPVSTGAALVALAVLLPWIDFGEGSPSVNALDVPLVFLLSWENGADGGPGLGLVLLLLAAAAFALRHLSGLEKRAKIPGALCVPLIAMFLVQMNALLGAFDGGDPEAIVDTPSLFDVVGVGAWLALIGAGLLAWGSARA